MSERQRWKDQPALARAAETVCLTHLTDGFCHPKDRPTCKCWDAASAVMQATGLSARATAWVFSRRHAIEEQAEKDETKTWNGTPWWSRKEAEGLVAAGEQGGAPSSARNEP